MKTTNLTFLEAVEAMKRGECYRDPCMPDMIATHRIKDGVLQYFDKAKAVWGDSAYVTDKGRIVPDPSKPEQRESEGLWEQYEKEMWENTDESKPKFAYVRDVLRRNKIFVDYILARVREEQGK